MKEALLFHIVCIFFTPGSMFISKVNREWVREDGRFDTDCKPSPREGKKRVVNLPAGCKTFRHVCVGASAKRSRLSLLTLVGGPLRL